MRNVLKIMLVSTLILISGYNVYISQQEEVEMSDLAMANVEALAEGEGRLLVGCDGSSVVIICKRTCWSCYREYIAVNGYGKSTGFKGQCECGARY